MQKNPSIWDLFFPQVYFNSFFFVVLWRLIINLSVLLDMDSCQKSIAWGLLAQKNPLIWEFLFALKVLDHNAFYGEKSSHMLGFFCMSRSLVVTFLHCATLVHERRIFVWFDLCIFKNNKYWLVDNIVDCINFLYIASYVLCKNNNAIHKLISIIFMNRQMK